jgi:hypothetical protein
MPEYLAEKIINEEQSYIKVFGISPYKKYQDDADKLLTGKGRSDLIQRQEV